MSDETEITIPDYQLLISKNGMGVRYTTFGSNEKEVLENSVSIIDTGSFEAVCEDDDGIYICGINGTCGLYYINLHDYSCTMCKDYDTNIDFGNTSFKSQSRYSKIVPIVVTSDGTKYMLKEMIKFTKSFSYYPFIYDYGLNGNTIPSIDELIGYILKLKSINNTHVLFNKPEWFNMFAFKCKILKCNDKTTYVLLYNKINMFFNSYESNYPRTITSSDNDLFGYNYVMKYPFIIESAYPLVSYCYEIGNEYNVSCFYSSYCGYDKYINSKIRYASLTNIFDITNTGYTNASPKIDIILDRYVNCNKIVYNDVTDSTERNGFVIMINISSDMSYKMEY